MRQETCAYLTTDSHINDQRFSRERRSRASRVNWTARAARRLQRLLGRFAQYQLSRISERSSFDPRKPHSMIIAIAIRDTAAVTRPAAMIRS